MLSLRIWDSMVTTGVRYGTFLRPQYPRDYTEVVIAMPVPASIRRSANKLAVWDERSASAVAHQETTFIINEPLHLKPAYLPVFFARQVCVRTVKPRQTACPSGRPEPASARSAWKLTRESTGMFSTTRALRTCENKAS